MYTIISCEYSEEVNSSANLAVGDVTSSELTVEMLSTEPIAQDDVLTYYMVEGEGDDAVETLIGVFRADKPTVASRTTLKFSAYDNIVKTEKLFSDWLRANQSLFPMTLLKLVQYACSYSGVTLATTDFPHANLNVNAFYDDGITCRQILSWAGSIAGRFVRASESGKIEFAWYEDHTHIVCNPSTYIASSPLTITDDGAGNISIESRSMLVMDDGEGNVSVNAPGATAVFSNGNVSIAEEVVIPYFQGSLKHENYTTDTIARVQINHRDDDVGVIFPARADGNCFTISNNMILGACSDSDVTSVATTLYNQLSTVRYVPANLRIPRTCRVRAGSIIRVRNNFEDVFETYVMKMTLSSSGTTLESTGDKSYGTDAAVAYENHSNLTGKMLTVTKNVSGLEVRNEDLEGKIAQLQLTTDEIKTSVSAVSTKVDNVTVGGTNLIIGSNNGVSRWSYNSQDGTATMSPYTDAAGTKGVSFTCTVAPTGWQYLAFNSPETLLKLTPYTEYTLGFDILSSFNCTIRFGIIKGNATLPLTGWATHSVVADGAWHHVSMKVKTNDLSNEVGQQVIYLADLNKAGSFTIMNLKLEVGNKSTDWSPAPEDVTGSIESLRKETTTQTTNVLQTCQELVSTATKTCVQTDDFAEYQSYVTTQFKQTADNFEMQFSSVQSSIDSVNADLQKKYGERVKYIRFVDGDIILGEDGNSLTLTIENDRLTFKQDGKEVAYFAYNKLYIVDAEFISSLHVGKFAYVPGSNGNLSFKKVSS